MGVLVAGEEKWKELFVWEGDFVWCEETRGGDCDEDDAYDERSQVQFRPLIYVSCQFEPGEKLFFFFLEVDRSVASSYKNNCPARFCVICT